jgi:hypothetical protein
MGISIIKDDVKKRMQLGYIDYFQFGLLILYLFLSMADFRIGLENYIMLILIIIWFFIAYTFSTHLFLQTYLNSKYLFFLIFSVFFITPQIIIGIGLLSIIKGYSAIIIVLAPIFIADYYKRKFGDSFFSFITKIIIGIFLYLSIRTLILLASTPKAARYLTYGSSADNYESMTIFNGVGGGYDLAYALCIILPVLFFQMGKKVSNIQLEKVMLFILSIIFLLTVIRSDFGMAFLFIIIGFICIFFSYLSRRSTLKFTIGLAFVMMLLITLKQPLGNMLLLISENINSSVIGIRLNLIGNFLNGNISLEDVSTRISRNALSLDTFLNYPLLGASVIANYDIEILRHSYIGNHSDILDTLAKYGLLAGLPFILFYYYSIKQIISMAKNPEDKIILIISSGIFVLMALFNYVNVTSIIIAISLANPGLLVIFNNIKQRNNKILENPLYKNEGR